MSLNTGIVVTFGDEKRTLREVLSAATAQNMTHVVIEPARHPTPPRATLSDNKGIGDMLKQPISWQDLRQVIDVKTGTQVTMYDMAKGAPNGRLETRLG